jgi:two-component system response regulator HydG
MRDALPTLLVIDDEPPMTFVIEHFATAHGFAVHSRLSGDEGLAALAELKPDVALVDLRLPGIDGLEVLRKIRAADPDCQVILMTGAATVESAITAVKDGALDYLAKPLDFDRLTRLLDHVKRGLEARTQLLDRDAAIAQQYEFHGMVGRGPVMQDLFDTIRRLSPHVRTVLVSGETGTGKEMVARALHAAGPRRTRKFVAVNCSTTSDTMFEPQPGDGTLFLDEVGELPMAGQTRLLRAIERAIGHLDDDGMADAGVCIVAATNRNLSAEADRGRLRQDLFHRLGVIEIVVPPLRQRREEIPYLTAAFIQEFAARLNRPITGITTAAERQLQDAPWPGNVRQLRNVIERACILADGRILNETDVVTALGSRQQINDLRAAEMTEPDSPKLLSHVQREQIQRVLNEVRGNKAAAARLLGVSRRALYRWIERLDIQATF